ncbi:MAG: hypothetical protein QME52_01380 [Bacteroidota bacterium]|nr:hypothetical protein [Bacteroidota bacterium]
MKKIIFIVVLLSLLPTNAYPCFDTYLFLRKGSMVYPYKSLVLDLNAEYSFNSMSNPQNDMFFSNGNLYYGAAQNLSLQISLGSGEKPRNDFKLDSYSLRGVYNLYSSNVQDYTLDVIAEHRGLFNGTENELTISLPNIFQNTEITYVLHPTASFVFEEKDIAIGGHTGLFYNFNESGIIGIGGEYASVQSSSSAGQRITQSEFAVSIFLGAHLGSSIYLQNEIAKGLANSRDFGFALTTKVIL